MSEGTSRETALTDEFGDRVWRDDDVLCMDYTYNVADGDAGDDDDFGTWALTDTLRDKLARLLTKDLPVVVKAKLARWLIGVIDGEVRSLDLAAAHADDGRRADRLASLLAKLEGKP